ncbi:MAG: nucleoside monophosphate kinase [Minisyncoccia bacterium]
MLHTVIFIGRSGCGKGTQAGLLKDRIYKQDLEKNPILYAETGERFRRFIKGTSYSADLSNKIYAADERQPDFLACLMWGGLLVEELEDNMHIVFDGAPRSKNEAEILMTALDFYRRENVTVIHIDVSRKWSEDRLLARGRMDDTSLSKINKRLDWFDADVKPALEYFKSLKNCRFIEVNGEQTIEKVFSDIVSEYDHKK